jgi:hypothetical protein
MFYEYLNNKKNNIIFRMKFIFITYVKIEYASHIKFLCYYNKLFQIL